MEKKYRITKTYFLDFGNKKIYIKKIDKFDIERMKFINEVCGRSLYK
jgi:hypothetical protein